MQSTQHVRVNRNIGYTLDIGQEEQEQTAMHVTSVTTSSQCRAV